MEKIVINPKDVDVFGNIISDKHGYLEDRNDFEAHKCEVSLNNTIGKGFNDYDIYSFRLTKNTELYNYFKDEIAYCKESSINEIYVCEHFDESFNPIRDIFDVDPFTNGYTLTVKDTYIYAEVDVTDPFFLLIHQDDTGVAIPNGTSRIVFTSNFDASNKIESIMVGFVFFDKDHNLLENQQIKDIASAGVGNKGRCYVQTTNIPRYAKYVSVEFQFPEGVNKKDYFSLELNCLLFNKTYDGFVKN